MCDDVVIVGKGKEIIGEGINKIIVWLPFTVKETRNHSLFTLGKESVWL